MKLSTVIIKTLLGSLFAGLGYFLTCRWFPGVVFLDTPLFLPTLTAFVLGAFSILLLPIVSFNVSEWFKNFVAAIVKENLKARLARSSLKKSRKQKRRGGVVLDTSAIIDGRILDVVRAGFLPGRLILPKFILDELHSVADSKDDLRRRRARRGFDCLENLKGLKKKDFMIWDGDVEGDDVDDRLVSLAKEMGAGLATVDFNLNKVAKVSGVAVLNINELANSLRVILVPGEVLKVKLVQKGKESGQGVGYLEDGTMIVVEDGESLVGERLQVEVTRTLQTEAGRMVFARRAVEK